MTRWAVGLAVAGLVVAPGALAWYGDDENSSGNVWGASTLNLSLRDLSNAVLTGLLFDITDMEPGDMKLEALKVKNDGDIDFTYKGLFAQTGGDTALCDALEVEAELDGGVVYTGPLSGFIANPAGTLVPGASHTWDFKVSLNDGDVALQEKSCDFDWVFMGWQTASDGTWGFTDTEKASNEIDTGSWVPNVGDVVINEVMWMGSVGDSDDEWVELRNTTASPIDLTGWEIDGAKSGSPGTLNLSGTIAADGYFLVSRKASGDSAISDGITPDMVVSGLSFKDEGEVLTLKDAFGNEIDKTPEGAWAEGEKTSLKKSMERNDEPGDGTSVASWHTCIDEDGVDDDCNDGTFWDTADGDNFGTPKAANLSSNDSTSDDYAGSQVDEDEDTEESEDAGDEEDVTAAGGEEGFFYGAQAEGDGDGGNEEDGTEGDGTEDGDTEDTEDAKEGEDEETAEDTPESTDGKLEEEEQEPEEDAGSGDEGGGGEVPIDSALEGGSDE